MIVTLLNSKEDWKQLEPEWKRLEQKLQNMCPFRSYWMFKQLFNQCDQVIQMSQGTTVVALIPLYRTSSSKWRTIGWRDVNYACFIYDPDWVAEIVKALIDFQKEEKRIIEWKGFRGWETGDSAWLYYLAYYSPLFTAIGITVPHLSLTEGLDTFLKQKQKFHHLRRRERRLAEKGAVEFCELKPTDWPDMIRLHHSRWATRRDTSGVYTPGKKEWLLQLWKYPSSTYSCKVVGIRVDQQLIAFQMDFISPKNVVGYWTGFDTAYSTYAPGFLLLDKGMRYFQQQQKHLFDFSLGYEKYKEQWSSRSSLAFQVVTASRVRLIHYLTIRFSYKVVALLKKSPKLVAWVRERRGVFHYLK